MRKTTSDNGFDDEKLVSFLQTYCPNTPLETKPSEELVMKAIANNEFNHQQKTHQIISKSWLLSTTLITTLLIIIGGYFFNLNPKSSSQIATEVEDLETFLVNSWYGSMVQESDFNLVTVSDEH